MRRTVWRVEPADSNSEKNGIRVNNEAEPKAFARRQTKEKR
jgi:hypothetical protein